VGIKDVEYSFRRINRVNYPELNRYSDAEIWRESGPGGLYLVAKMLRYMNLKKGDIVLDLGCGRGESSIYLAKHYGVHVFAVDLWTPSTYLSLKIRERGFQSKIVPLNLDARKPLPFAHEYFDAIFCMNALSFFGGDIETLNRLSSHLKEGGVFCVGGECLSHEFTENQLANPPDVYNFVDGIWEGDFLKLHSPSWWKELFQQTNELEVKQCHELMDGRIMYEDEILNKAPEGYLGLSPQQARDIEIKQIIYGRTNKPYMTIYILSAEKSPAR
jgi:SAM-dependent methyltransferase